MVLNRFLPVVLCLITGVSCSNQETRKIPADVILKGEIPESISKTDEGEDEKIQFQAKVIEIVDGDTVEILYHKLPLRIRMKHIDAPEKRGSQPYGNKAKSILSGLCFGEKVTIVTEGDFDMGGRLIAEIYNSEGTNINKEMVRLGYAWHFKKYSDDLNYAGIEKEARQSKRGLWQNKNPVAPWVFRE